MELMELCCQATQAHLSVAGEGGVVEQEVGTKEEDDGVEHAQTRPVQEDRPAKQGVLSYIPEKHRNTQRETNRGKTCQIMTFLWQTTKQKSIVPN